MIAQYARTENAHSEEVTAQISISSKNASDRLVAVFFCGRLRGYKGSVIDSDAKAGRRWLTVSCDDVPRCRVERYRSQRKKEGRFGRVDEGTERHDCYVVVEDNTVTTEPRHSGTSKTLR